MGMHSLCNRTFTPDEVADILYKSIVENKSAHLILRDEVGIPETEINKMGRRGPINYLRNFYKSWGFPKKFSGFEYPPYVSITWEGMRDYVYAYWNRPTSESHLISFFPFLAEPLRLAHEWDKKQPTPEWGSGSGKPFEFNFDSPNRRIPAEPKEPRRRKTDKPRRRRYNYNEYDSGLDFSWIKRLLKIILAIAVIIVAIGGVKALFSKISAGKTTVKTSFGRNYKIETYEFNGHKYIGNQKRNKPNGINLRYTPSFGPYELGTIDKGESISGEGVSYDGHNSIIIGKRKKGEFKRSWCIRCSYGITQLAVFKDNMPQGRLVVYRENGVTHLMNYSRNKEIATYQNGSWIKPNGKPLKLKKDGSYKKLILKDATHFEADGIEFCIDCENLSYNSKVFEFNGTYSSFTAGYNSEADHINLTYQANSLISMDLNGYGWNLTPQE